MGAPCLRRMADLDDGERAALAALGKDVYPPGSLEGWPGLAVEWDSPEWGLLVEDAGLACFVGLYVREARLDGRTLRIGGVGNVKTRPDARGRGHASAAMRAAEAFFAGQPGLAFALLVCEAELEPFYARLGWKPFAGKVMTLQRGKAAEFQLCGAMVRSVAEDAPTSGVLDLQGRPW